MKVYQLQSGHISTLFTNKEAINNTIKQCIVILEDLKLQHDAVLQEYKDKKIKDLCFPKKSDYVKTKYLDNKEKHNLEMKSYRNACNAYHMEHGDKYTKENYNYDVYFKSTYISKKNTKQFLYI